MSTSLESAITFGGLAMCASSGSHYPDWTWKYDLRALLTEIIEELRDRRDWTVNVDAH
jgi:hypothetical protein